MDNYNNLCENVRSWVDGQIADFEDSGGDLSTIASATNDPRFRNALQHFPQSLESLVEARIHSLLHETLLADNQLFLGLEDVETRFVGMATLGMAALKPTRGKVNSLAPAARSANYHADSETINHWQSELMKALEAVPRMHERREQEIEDLTWHILAKLNHIFPFLQDNLETALRLHKEVLLSAATFEASIHTSSNKYCFPRWRVPEGSPFPRLPASALEEFNCIDAKTRKRLKYTSLDLDPEKEDMGHYLESIVPGLGRKTKDTVRCLQKERILVYLLCPLRRSCK